MNRFHPSITAMLLVALLAPLASAAAERSEEQWFVLTLQGKPAGWARFGETEADGKITTEHRVRISLARAGAAMTIEMAGRFVETSEGEPIEASTTQQLGAQAKSTTVRFTKDGLKVTHESGGQQRTTTRPAFKGEWLTPAAAGRYLEKQLEAGAETITYRSFDPMAGLEPVETTIEVEGRETVEVFGRTVKATKVKTGLSNAPGLESVGWVDAEGKPLKVEMGMGMLKLTMLAADKQLAQAQVAPPELLIATLVKPKQPLNNPRQMRQATYRLRLKGEGRAKLPEVEDAGAQRYERADDGRSATVTVDLDKPVDGPAEAPAVQHTMIADGRVKAIGDLVDRATKQLGDDAGAAARAEAIREFVHRFIDAKSLDVGLASATEVARTGKGDCTEHAVLLTAMLRADGVPSRTVTGLVYVDAALGAREVFGYHMWSQAWLDGRWVDLDATLGPDTPFDAAHIAFGHSDMAEGEMVNDMVVLAPLFGRLEIEPVQ